MNISPLNVSKHHIKIGIEGVPLPRGVCEHPIPTQTQQNWHLKILPNICYPTMNMTIVGRLHVGPFSVKWVPWLSPSRGIEVISLKFCRQERTSRFWTTWGWGEVVQLRWCLIELLPQQCGEARLVGMSFCVTTMVLGTSVTGSMWAWHRAASLRGRLLLRFCLFSNLRKAHLCWEISL